jgi:sortase (surface protein transpeptidase)
MKITSINLVWLLRILGIVLILAGASVVTVPYIQNIFSIADQEKALVEWKVNEEQYKQQLEKIKEEEKLELKEGKSPAEFLHRMLIPAIELDTVAISGHRTTYGKPFFNLV